MSLGWAQNRLAEMDSVGLFSGAEVSPDPDYNHRRKHPMPMTVRDLKRALRNVPDSVELEVRLDGGEYNVKALFDTGREFVIQADPEDTEAYTGQEG